MFGGLHDHAFEAIKLIPIGVMFKKWPEFKLDLMKFNDVIQNPE